MCFSAKSSFGAAGILAVIGTLTFKKVTRKAQIPFALIPYFFAIQQFTEGLLWLALKNQIFDANSFIVPVATYTFLFFAFVVWPIWLPGSIIIMQHKDQKTKVQKFLLYTSLITGFIVAGYSIFCIAQYGASAQILKNHILYNIQIPEITGFDFVFYLIATILPFFIASNKLMKLFGITALLSLYLTYTTYLKFLISVWCFFAAILSIITYFIIAKSR